MVVDSASEKTVSAEFGDLKVKTFGCRDVEIKSNWLRQPKERERRYLKKYGITQADLSRFTDDLHDWIAAAPLEL